MLQESRTQLLDPAESRTDEPSLCIICEDRERGVRLPCGHAVLCESCTNRLILEDQPCPACRSPFKKYYRTPKSTDRASFLDPATQRDQFGRLTRMNTLTALTKMWRELRVRGQTCFQIIYAVILVTLLFLFFLSPLALAVLEFLIGFRYRDDTCDRPLSTWLLGVAAFHMLVFVRSLTRCQSQQQRNSSEHRCLQHVVNVSGVVLLAVGASYVYRVEDCPFYLRTYSWYAVTVTLGILAVSVVAMLVLVMLNACCGSRSNEGEGDPQPVTAPRDDANV